MFKFELARSGQNRIWFEWIHMNEHNMKLLIYSSGFQYNRTWSHELTLPSAKRWERCHLPPHSPELQRLWWPDSECQAEETEMHGCHFLIFHCDNHNVCTESLRGNLWGRCAAGTSKMSACVRVKRNHNKHKHEARACENVCERREPSV